MTRTVPAGLQAHLNQPVTSLATLWRITRRDGAVLHFTDHDADIVFGGNTYVAAVGYQRTDIGANATLAVDSLDLQGILNAAEISESDLRGGRYDYAAVRVSLVNWKNPDGDGEVSLVKGWLGEVIYDEAGGAFSTELRSLFQAYQQTIVEQYGRMCRYDFGDGRCDRDKKFNLAAQLIANNTAYQVGDVVRVPVAGAASPPTTADLNDTVYRVTTAGTTHATLPFIFHSSAGPDGDSGATTLSVTGPSSFTRAAGSFIDDGFVADMVITASGFANGANNGLFRIVSVAAATITVTAATLVTEAGGGDERLVQTNSSGTVAFAAEPANRIAGQVLAVESQSVFVAGPPAGPGSGLLKQPIFFENPGFETGSLAPWIVTIPGEDPGNSIITAPAGNPGPGTLSVHSGTFACQVAFQRTGAAGDTEMIQDIDIADWAAEIDAGGQTVTMQWWMRDPDPFPSNFSNTFIDIDWLDGSGALISTGLGSKHTATNGLWQQKTRGPAAIPALTRTLRVKLKSDSGLNGAIVDDFTISTTLTDTDFPDDAFNYGVLTFDTGLNAGLSFEVKDYDSTTKTFTLYLPAPYPIAVGDAFGVHIGCNKELSRCQALDNVINHGGFPTIPGDDEFLRYPDAPA